MPLLKISPFNDSACRVLSQQGEHVGNLKLVNGQWKFKQLVWITPWPRQPDTLPKREDLKELGIDW